ncbi:MAG: hypothetical protein E7213_00135 [Clostridium sp.]|nr:hypothetical protein [Clostridium sp.]
MSCSMMGLIKNELIKIYHKKKLFICIIILIVTALWTLGGATNRIDEKMKSLEDTKASVSMNESARDEIIKRTEKSIDEYKRAKEYSDEELQDFYKEYIDNMEQENEDNKDEFINCNVNFIKYLSDNNLRPTTDIDLNSNEIMKRGIKIFSLVAIFIVVLITSDIISSEYTKGTLKVLITRPFLRRKIIVSKFMASTIICSGIVLFFELFVYGVGVIMKGYTSLSYPEKIYPAFESSDTLNVQFNSYIQPILNTSDIIPEWQLFLKCLILQILFIACLVSISMLFSSLMKSGAMVVMVNVFLAFVSIGITMYDTIKIFSYFSPYNYYDSIGVVNRECIMMTSACYVSFVESIVVLLLFIAGNIFVSCKLINRKDIYI